MGFFDNILEGGTVEIKVRFPCCQMKCQMCGFAEYDSERRIIDTIDKKGNLELRTLEVPITTCKLIRDIADNEALSEMLKNLFGSLGGGKKKDDNDDDGDDDK
tara:strand:+ start:830 stop:1138 length:309 start_codon:yes stop_codon:yes gene_type:complete